jgi:hypothetical protein
MLKKSLARSHDEFLCDLMDAYRNDFGGGYTMEDVTEWILANDLLPLPSVNPKRLLTHKLKQAARRRRFKDHSNRTVRTMVAAKFEGMDENGNRVFDVVWDYLHTMSTHHALTSFSQRDEVIEKQRLAATRDVHSFLEFNPNAKGFEGQFQFAFMLEEPMPVVVETIQETNVPLSQKKPR